MTLHLYFAGRFLRWFAIVFFGLFIVLFLTDLVEHLRRYGDDGLGLAGLVRLTLLNAPTGMYQILPLVAILSAIALFLGLARSSELVVTRAVGRSALRSLVAPVVAMALLGVLFVAVMNPIVAATQRAYEAAIGNLRGEESVLSVSDDGLWLRQGGPEGQTVIEASRASLDGTLLFDVSFMTFAPDSGPVARIDAASARLEPDGWHLSDTKSWPISPAVNAEASAVTRAELVLPSNLTADRIRDSFGAPSSIPIWDLPRFIEQLERAGFSARRHAIWFQTQLALPLYLVSMVMLGAAFTMRPQRQGRTGQMVLAAILLGFALFFVRNTAIILAENGQVPVLLAAWAPPLASLGIVLGLLLHMEDG